MTDFDPHEASWRKSTASSGNNDAGCVEITAADDTTWVRDSKDRPGPGLAFPRTAWNTFLVRLADR